MLVYFTNIKQFRTIKEKIWILVFREFSIFEITFPNMIDVPIRFFTPPEVFTFPSEEFFTCEFNENSKIKQAEYIRIEKNH